jgi:hypothetical protein
LNSIRKGYSVNEKTLVLKRLLPSFGELKSSAEFSGVTVMNHRMRFLLLFLFASLAQSHAQTVQEEPAQATTVPENHDNYLVKWIRW